MTLAWKLVLFLICRLPKPILTLLAEVLAKLIPLLARRDLRQAKQNIKMIYGLGPQNYFAKRFCQQCLRHQAHTALETIRTIYQPSCTQIDGIDSLRDTMAALKSAHGTIVISAHIGSWELVAYSVATVCANKLHVLAKPSSTKSLNPFLGQLRVQMGTEVLWTDKKTILRDMLQTIRSGDMLGFVMDQKPKGRQGVSVEFLGAPADFALGAALIAVKTQCPIVAIFCLRLGPWRYKVEHRIITRSDHGLLEEQALTIQLVKEIERIVEHYPEQWTWNYKRWVFERSLDKMDR